MKALETLKYIGVFYTFMCKYVLIIHDNTQMQNKHVDHINVCPC